MLWVNMKKLMLDENYYCLKNYYLYSLERKTNRKTLKLICLYKLKLCIMKNNLRNIKIKKLKISKLLMLCLFILNVEMTQAQKEDFVWPLGTAKGSKIEVLIADSINKLYWPFDFNFNEFCSLDHTTIIH